MSISVTPTANTPGITEHSDHNHHGNSAKDYMEGFSWSHLTQQIGEQSRDLMKAIIENAKDVQVAVERNGGEMRKELAQVSGDTKLAIAVVDKNVEIQGLRTQAFVNEARLENRTLAAETSQKAVDIVKVVEDRRQDAALFDLKRKVDRLSSKLATQTK